MTPFGRTSLGERVTFPSSQNVELTVALPSSLLTSARPPDTSSSPTSLLLSSNHHSLRASRRDLCETAQSRETEKRCLSEADEAEAEVAVKAQAMDSTW
jgi:hypothetical protein